MDDRERTVAAAVEAAVGGVLVIGGALMLKLDGFGNTIGVALLFLGVIGLGHAVLLGLGVIALPASPDAGKNSRDDTHDGDRG